MILTALRIGANGLRSSCPSIARNSFLRGIGLGQLSGLGLAGSKGGLRSTTLDDFALVIFGICENRRPQDSGSRVSAASPARRRRQQGQHRQPIKRHRVIRRSAICDKPQTTRNSPATRRSLERSSAEALPRDDDLRSPPKIRQSDSEQGYRSDLLQAA